MNKKIKIIGSILLPIQWLIIKWLSKNPSLVETYYSQGFYPKIIQILQAVFGWSPFPIGDLFYFLLGIWMIYLCYRFIKDERSKKITHFLSFTTTLSLVYFIFHLFWAINYYRKPLYSSMEMSADYTTEELYNTTKKLIYSTNLLYSELTPTDSIMEIPYSKKEIRQLSALGYEVISKDILSLISPKNTKNSLFSLMISYLGYGGYFNPFTGEAQINAKIPKSLYAVIAAHEQAHQLGYAAENEANFLGVLASIKNPDSFMQYSGYSYGLRYCLSELARRDKDLYQELYQKIDPRILNMYKAHQEFWKKYDTPIDTISKIIWDNFLKASKQKEGITSYNYIVALLVNFDKTHPDIF